MIDWLRNLTKPAAAKRQERLNAYLDDALSARERTQFEQEMTQEEALQSELTQLRMVHRNLRQLPRRRVPRNFMLDPAVYGRPQREPLVQAYPALRFATVLTAFFFIVAIAFQMVSTSGGDSASLTAFTQSETQVVEVTRVVSEVAAIEGESVEMTRVVSDEAFAAPAEAAPMAADSAAGVVAEVVETEMEEVAEMAVAEEEAEEEMAEVAADTAAPAEAPAAPDTTRAGDEGDGEDGPAVGAASIAATPSPASTQPAEVDVATASPVPLPSATVSDIPRPAATEEGAANRALITPPVAQEPVPLTSADSDTPAETTAVDENVTGAFKGPESVFPWLPVSLGGLFVALAALTWIARRRL